MSLNKSGLIAQQETTARLTALLTSNFSFLTSHGVNTAECRKWLESQTPQDRLLLERWLDKTAKLQSILRKAQAQAQPPIDEETE
jgi:hypothetical protein